MTRPFSKAANPAISPEAGTMSRVSEFCGYLMEACWLAALAIIPVIYNPHGLMGFQPNKVVFLRMFASITVAAWIIRVIEQPPAFSSVDGRLRSLLKNPLVLLLSALVLAYGTATAFSVYPAASFWGSPEYRQGMVTFLSQMVILGSVATCLRTLEQLERLVTVIAASSLPLAFYAMIERYGIDPLHVNMDPVRVCSLIGHPIYLGGYLLMVLPLMVWRVVRLVDSIRSDRSRRPLKWATLLFYCLVVLAQSVAFLCAQSRGPLMGLAAGFAFMAVGLSVRRRNWQLLAISATTGFLAVGSFLLMGLQKGFFGRLASLPGLSHFARTLPVGSNADPFRFDIWGAAPGVILSPSPLPFGTGGMDHFHWLRPWIGYGPETVQNVLPHFFTYSDWTSNIEDRFHNLVWDMWFGIGGIGLVAFLGMVLMLFFRGYRYLGWIGSKRSRFLFWLLVFGCAVGESTALAIYAGPGFFGLGLLIGIVSGLLLHPLIAAFLREVKLPPPVPWKKRGMLMIVLLAALAGHLVDMAFAFPSTPNMLLFAVYAGIILALVHPTRPFPLGDPVSLPQAAERRGETTSAAKRPVTLMDRKALMECVALASIIMVTMIFVFVQAFSDRMLDIGSLAMVSFVWIPGSRDQSYLLFLLILPVWVGVTFAFASDLALRTNGVRFRELFAASAFYSGLAMAGYFLVKAFQIVSIGPIPRWDGIPLDGFSQSFGYETICLVFVALIAGTAVALGMVLAPRKAGRVVFAVRPWSAVGGFLVAIALIFVAVIQPLCADVAAGWAKALNVLGRPMQSVVALREAIAIDPGSTLYRRTLANTLVNVADTAPAGEYPQFMTEAEGDLIQANVAASGMDNAIYDLGQLYLKWAGRATRPTDKLALARKASTALDKALVYEPASPYVWVESANISANFLDQPHDAEQKARKLLDVVRDNPEGWGDICRDASLGTADPDIRRQYAARAWEAYECGINDPATDEPTVARCRLGEGTLYMAENKPDQAIKSLLQALKSPLGDRAWQAEASVASIDLQRADFSAARQYIERAIADAPLDRKAGLFALKQRILRQ
jgi:hypothetical protein